jgi:VWFA-related protein
MRTLAAVLALSLPLAAQVTETIEVAITSVDVVVTDAKGNPVRGLTRADFEVIEEGKGREITNFSEYALSAPPLQASESGTATPSAGSPQAVQTPPRRLLILFDANTLTAKHRRSCAAEALKFVDKHVRPADRVMVAVLGRNFTPRTDWTSDRDELRSTIEVIGSEVTALGADAYRKQVEEEMVYLIDIVASTIGTDQRNVVPPRFEELVTLARRYADRALAETHHSAGLIEKVISQFSTYPEKKAVILIGEGLDARPGWELFEKLESLRSGKEPGVGIQIMLGANAAPASTLLGETGRYSAAGLLQSVAESAYRKGVPIFAINPGVNEEADTESTNLTNSAQQFARFVSKADGYKMVGEGSGGAAYIGVRADQALEQVATALGSYYSIGFRASGPPKRTAIRVTPRNPAHHLRVALAGTPASTDAITDAVIAHHVIEPVSNDLEIALDTRDAGAAGGKHRVTLEVIIPIRNLSLVRQGDQLAGGLDVYVSISDGKGYFSPVNRQSQAIRIPAATGEDDDRTMTYTIDVTMEAGTSQISVGVVDQRSKKTGYDRIGV